MSYTPGQQTLSKRGISAAKWVETAERQGWICARPTCGLEISQKRFSTYRNEAIMCRGCIGSAERFFDGKIKCALCGELKDPDGFPSARKKRSGQPRYAYCKTCHSAYQRKQSLKIKFNITTEEYEKILLHQNGACAICKRPPKAKRLAVDHCHRTGLIRGLLCTFCNRVLGLFRDDRDRFLMLVAYLDSPTAVAALGESRHGVRGRSTNKVSTMERLNPDLRDRKRNWNFLVKPSEQKEE